MSIFGPLPHLPVPVIGAASDGLSRETVFEMLRNTRRRYVFHILRQREGSVSLGTLCEQVAATEYETTVTDLDPAQRQRVYVSLRQNHLPKLHEADVVEFDPEANTVRLAENARDLQVYLEAVPDDDILWAQYYLGLAGVGVVFLVLAWLAISPFVGVVPYVGIVIFALLGGSAVLHHRHLTQRRLGTGESPL